MTVRPRAALAVCTVQAASAAVLGPVATSQERRRTEILPASGFRVI